MDKNPGKVYWALITMGILLCLLILVGQTGSLIDYDLTVSFDLQESAEEVTPVGVAWAKSFAIGDTFIYLPLLIAGIIGTLKRRRWGLLAFFGALAITVYWPVVCLTFIYIGKGAISLRPDKYTSLPVILVPICVYGLWGMWFIFRNWDRLQKN